MTNRKMHPNSLKNLKKGMFKKGENGQGKGGNRPRLTTILEEILEGSVKRINPLTQKKENHQLAVHVTLQIIANALLGKQRSLSMIMDRVDGPVQQQINMTSTDAEKVDRYAEQIEKNLLGGLDLMADVEIEQDEEDT